MKSNVPSPTSVCQRGMSRGVLSDCFHAGGFVADVLASGSGRSVVPADQTIIETDRIGLYFRRSA